MRATFRRRHWAHAWFGGLHLKVLPQRGLCAAPQGLVTRGQHEAGNCTAWETAQEVGEARRKRVIRMHTTTRPQIPQTCHRRERYNGKWPPPPDGRACIQTGNTWECVRHRVTASRRLPTAPNSIETGRSLRQWRTDKAGDALRIRGCGACVCGGGVPGLGGGGGGGGGTQSWAAQETLLPPTCMPDPPAQRQAPRLCSAARCC